MGDRRPKTVTLHVRWMMHGQFRVCDIYLSCGEFILRSVNGIANTQIEGEDADAGDHTAVAGNKSSAP